MTSIFSINTAQRGQISHKKRSVGAFLAVSLLPLMLSACGSNAADPGAEIDNELMSNDGPSTNVAQAERIVIDSDEPAASKDGATIKSAGAAQASGDIVSAQELDGVKLMRAPAPTVVGREDCDSCNSTQAATTLGERAAAQKNGQSRGKGTCDAKLQYGNAWAGRMPPEFPVYPNSRINEAAGVDGGLCDIRVASFTTNSKMQNVVDYYYTRAKKSGYSAEYQIRAGEHSMGGTRNVDDGAFFITFNPTKNGGTKVDIVANNGR
ncbi:hypothetical protein LPB140_11730 [Sphingorhabdus lutea]|uniref:Uncharacterized protein n=1 Tax=Sphingorhabdus lutea TaxID=1913578 RepID=A0A1L3JE10_9SPHN|nr:hypothetical protein [Sphingorhabdus lutea]APG63346.1 hypothetical protein LPB140_11730 [Sphingorhabdus lutea]